MLKSSQFPDIPVLLGDESAFARRTVRSMLEQCGIRQIVEASDGADALTRLSQFRPGLIILDWNMPIIDGPGLIDLIREPSSGIDRAIPIMITTTAPTPRLMEQARARDVAMVLRKPFSPKVLWARLRSCLAPAMLAQEEAAAVSAAARVAV
jgi:two-component system chemotaxis response regulator CheY